MCKGSHFLSNNHHFRSNLYLFIISGDIWQKNKKVIWLSHFLFVISHPI